MVRIGKYPDRVRLVGCANYAIWTVPFLHPRRFNSHVGPEKKRHLFFSVPKLNYDKIHVPNAIPYARFQMKSVFPFFTSASNLFR